MHQLQPLNIDAVLLKCSVATTLTAWQFSKAIVALLKIQGSKGLGEYLPLPAKGFANSG